MTPEKSAFTTPEKSAFTPAIYGELPPEFYMPGVETTSRLVRLQNIMPKPHQTFDLFMAYHRPTEAVASAFKQFKQNSKAPAWLKFMKSLTKTQEYLKVNRITRGSTELAAAAAARTLAAIVNAKIQTGGGTYTIEDLDNIINNIESNDALRQEVQKAGGVEAYLELAMGQAAAEVAQELEQLLKELSEYLDAKAEAAAAAAQLAGGFSYSLEGLSIWSFLNNPDEFRRGVRLLSAAALALRMFSRVLPASLERQQTESLWGGLDGVTSMRTYTQLPDVLPSELALMHASRALFVLKLAQMSLSVYRRAAALKPVVFIDKSGSMDEPLEGRQKMPKISLAAGLGLALYRKYGATIYLFDTEVEAVSPKEVVKTLLAIRADGGTAIDPVLEEITRLGRRDYVYLIISDGITEASEEVLRRFAASGLAKQVRVILVPPSEQYEWLTALKRHGGRVVKATDVAGFMAAARQALTT